MDVMALAMSCAPWVHPQTITAIVEVESHGEPWVIGTPEGPHHAPTQALAETFLSNALAQHRSVDIGLMQINSQWIKRLHIDPESLLDPCTNLRIGSAILATNFATAMQSGHTSIEALIAALSVYNTGSEKAGLGYAKRVLEVPFGDASPAKNATRFGDESPHGLSETRAQTSPLTFSQRAP